MSFILYPFHLILHLPPFDCHTRFISSFFSSFTLLYTILHNSYDGARYSSLPSSPPLFPPFPSLLFLSSHLLVLTTICSSCMDYNNSTWSLLLQVISEVSICGLFVFCDCSMILLLCCVYILNIVVDLL